MPNFPIRLAQGQGLERSGAAQTQAGLTVLHNTDLSARDVIRHRAGYPPVAMVDESGETVTEIRALWARDGDLCAEATAGTPDPAYPLPRLWSYTPTLTTKWRDVGPWSRMQLRDIGAYAYQSGEILNVSSSGQTVNGADAQWTVIQRVGGVSGAAAILVRESDGLEQEELLSATALQPIICRVDDTRALIAYNRVNSIRYREVSPDLGAEVATTVPISTSAWFAAAAQFATGTPFYVFAALDTLNQLVLRFVAPGFTSFTFVQALSTITGTKRDVDIKIVGAEFSAQTAFVYVAAAGGLVSEAFRFVVNMSLGTCTLTGQAATTHVDDVMAIAADPVDGDTVNCYVELSVGGIAVPRVEYREYTLSLPAPGGGSVLISSRLRTALLSNTAAATDINGSGGTGAIWCSMVSNTSRRGAVLWRGLTDEVIARAGVGLNETFDERVLRKAHYPANRDDAGRIVVASRYTVQALDTVAREAAVWTVTPATINRPAVLDGVAVSAHGGYPRAYDGQQLFEHDWHELPEYQAATSGAAGFAAGSYGLAVTDEWADRTGQVYRSAPTFSTITLNGAQTATLTLQPLQWTERTGVRRVLWRTRANGTTYYRTSTDFDAHTATTATYTEVDAQIIGNETLDQVQGGVLPSEQARVTDFVAAVGARLWTRDPRRGRLARFSQPRQEGFAPGWPLELGVELDQDRDITAIEDLDGRVVLFGAEQIAYTQGDGPDLTGAGAYPVPSALPVEIGAQNQATIARCPFGLYFGSEQGIRLLARSLTVANLSEAVDALYEIDGQDITGVVYRSDGAELVVTTSSGLQLIYHDQSARWASWGPDVGEYTVVAAAQFGGVVAWADDAAVVHIRNATVFSDDGANSYAQVIGTPWLRPYANSVAHTSFNLQQITVFGSYEDAHGLQLDVYLDDETTPRFSPTVDAVDIVANAAAGLPYLYRAELGGVACYTARVELRSVHDAPGRSFRLEGKDITYSPTDATGVQLPAELLFAE